MNPQLTVIPERTALPSETNTGMSLLVKMHVPPMAGAVPAVTGGVNLALVLDRSASMGCWGRLVQAKLAAHALIDQLSSADRVSVVTFSSAVEVLASAVPGDSKALLHDLVDTVRAAGRTDLHGGWLAGAHEVAAHFRQGALNRVMLLSDGQVNRGVTRQSQIIAHVASLCATSVSTTVIGLGMNYNEELLEAMAEAGDGSYNYIPSAEALPALFAAELTEQRQVRGTRAVFRVLQRARGVKVLAPINDLSEVRNGGYALGNLMEGKTLQVVFDAIFPAVTDVDEPLLTVELEWRDHLGTAHSVTSSLLLPRVSEDAHRALQPNPQVMMERALLQAAQLKRQAARALDWRCVSEAVHCFDQAVALLQPLAAQPAAKRMIESLEELRSLTLAGQLLRSSKQAKYESYRQRRKGD